MLMQTAKEMQDSTNKEIRDKLMKLTDELSKCRLSYNTNQRELQTLQARVKDLTDTLQTRDTEFKKQMEQMRLRAYKRLKAAEAYEDQKNDGIIYLVQNKETGEKYVGSSKNSLQVAWNQKIKHAREKRTDKLSKNILQYGKESFEVSILYECKSYDTLWVEKDFWIGEISPELNTYRKFEE